MSSRSFSHAEENKEISQVGKQINLVHLQNKTAKQKKKGEKNCFFA